MAAPMKCIVHLLEKEDNSRIQAFTDKTWQKFQSCYNQWVSLDGPERARAEEFINKDATEPGESDGFHLRCYQRFTDKQRIICAQKRKSSGKLKSIQEIDTDSTDEKPEETIKRQTRSDHTVLSCPTRVKHVLPEICLICRKDKYITDKSCGKRQIEKLVRCETEQNNLLRVAHKLNDDSILIHIRGKDLVAIELRYHKSCYKAYIQKTNKTLEKHKVVPIQMYGKSFDVFCQEVVERRLQQCKETLPLSKLTSLFVKTVSNTEKLDASNYSNQRLKNRLLKRYPNINFLQGCRKNESELVFFQCESLADSYSQEIYSSDVSESEIDMSEVNENQYRNSELRDAFSTSQLMKTVINNSPNLDAPWPPTAQEVNMTSARNLVPPELFNFIAWCTGNSDEPTFDDHVNVSADVERKILSISQDIIHLASKGRKQMPKHLGLGMTVRHLTGSSSLIQLLNRLGHSVSHSTVLEHDTALASLQIQRNDCIQPGFSKKVFTTLVWDNNDFGEETLTGKGTTHNTNGIIIQHTGEVESSDMREGIPRTFKRTAEAPIMAIEDYINVKKQGPKLSTDDIDLDSAALKHEQKPFHTLDSAYFLCKLPEAQDENEDDLPGWTGFNILLHSAESQVLVRSKIGYLPVIDASPVEMSTVSAILNQSIIIADRLEVDSLVVVFDQAIYAKAQQIRWQNETFRKRLVIRLGEFHSCMSFLAVLGKRFADAGLRDILVESGVVTEGSVNGVITGHFYNRSIRCHKLMAEALHRLLWSAYLDHLSVDERLKAVDMAKQLRTGFPLVFAETVQNQELQEVLSKAESFTEMKCKDSPTFAFWISYLSLVETLLLFIRATREGNWKLHLSVVRDMIPWYFAYDRVNYSRYMSIYWIEMMKLKTTHPEVLMSLLDGQFAVQKQSDHNFSKTACDQVIEQTCNRDSKTKGGLTGLTLKKSAVHRWILSHHDRAAISNECFVMAGKETTLRSHKETDKTRIHVDEEAVQSIVTTVTSMINPFAFPDDVGLHNISTGMVAPKQVSEDISKAGDIGEQSFLNFVKERITSDTKSLFSPIKTLKLKTFTNVGKTSTSKLKQENVAIKASRNLIARMLMIAKLRHVHLEEIFSFCLSPIPPSLGNYDGSMVKTNKASLLHKVFETVPGAILSTQPSADTLVIDAMALLQQLRNIPESFGLLADQILKQIILLADRYKCQRVDFVADRYPDCSIKMQERDRRASQGSQLLHIYSGNQNTPRQFRKFLMSGRNKEALVEFIFEHWKKMILREDIIIFVTHGLKCHSIQTISGSTEATEIPELTCDHEEADTRMLLHAAHAAETTNRVLIKSSDTDVVMLAIGHSHSVDAELFLLTGTAKDLKLLNISAFREYFGVQKCAALIGLHVFTGCDSVSSFKGKGKGKALNLMLGSEYFTTAFSILGQSWVLSEDVFCILEEFVCSLYGQAECTSANTARYNIFRVGLKNDSVLPPNRDSLHLHSLRANYQCSVHRLSLKAIIDARSPLDHGWIEEDGKLTFKWMTLPLAPDVIINSVQCKCKKSTCITNQCSCHQAKLECTEMCLCHDCANTDLHDVISCDGSSSSEAEEEDED